MKPVYISSLSTISALGNDPKKILESYDRGKALFLERDFGRFKALASELSIEGRNEIETLRKSNPAYRNLDDSVLYAICASRKAIGKLSHPPSLGGGWGEAGINIGSSRGATGLFEKHHESFLKTGKTETLASPTTTLGNISSWVAQDLQSKGPAISHSITCSTALHSFLNGIAWLRSGMAERFLVGGSEAPLTGFTIAQMKALKLYARENSSFPCESMRFGKKSNSMILGEAAGIACLETENNNAIAKISGYGFATEKISHNISISSDAACFQKSMNMALESAGQKSVDVVVMHAPGTVKGDLAELRAVQKCFQKLPALTSNKWLIGHTFGASGIMSVEMAVLMLQNQRFFENPFHKEGKQPQKIDFVMVNAVGFGGNAVSLILERI